MLSAVINLAFTSETELVRFRVSRLANEHLQLAEPIPIRHGVGRPFISQSDRTRNGVC